MLQARMSIMSQGTASSEASLSLTCVCVSVTQVLSTQQLAGLMVHTYPFLPILVRMLDAVAARCGMHDLVIPPTALGDPEQLAADWGLLEAYVARIETQIWHDYVPLNMSSQVAVWPKSD